MHGRRASNWRLLILNKLKLDVVEVRNPKTPFELMRSIKACVVNAYLAANDNTLIDLQRPKFELTARSKCVQITYYFARRANLRQWSSGLSNSNSPPGS
jgi:hypothetical protein